MALSSGLIEKLRYELALDGSGAKKHAKSMEKVFGNLNKTALLAAGAVAAIGLVGAAFIAKGLSAAIKYEKAWAEVATILNATAGEQKALNHQIEELSTRVPESAISLAKGFYQVLSSGITEAAEATEVLDVASRLAAAGLTDSFTAVDTITTILNAFGKEAAEAEQVADVLFTTVREGKLTFTTLAGSIGKAIPFFAQSGLAIEELTAAMATLTKGGLQADIASTALRATITQIIKPSQDAQKIAAALGLELNSTALKTKGLVGFLAQLRDVTKSDVAILSQLFPNVRGLAAVLALAGKQNEEFNRILGVTIEAEGSMNRAFLTMNETISSQAKIVENKAEKKWVEFGNKFMGVAKGIIAAFSGLNVSVQEHAQGTERLAERYRFLTQEVPELVERYEQLMDVSHRSTEEQAELDKILNDVTESFPRLIGEIDAHGKIISLNIPILGAYTDLLRQQLIASEDITFGNLIEEYNKASVAGEHAKHVIDAITESHIKEGRARAGATQTFQLPKYENSAKRIAHGLTLVSATGDDAAEALVNLSRKTEEEMEKMRTEAEETAFVMRGFERIVAGLIKKAGLEEQFKIWREQNKETEQSTKELQLAFNELRLIFPMFFKDVDPFMELLTNAGLHLDELAEAAAAAEKEVSALFADPEIAGALSGVLEKEEAALVKFTKFINEELGVDVNKKTVGLLAVLPDQRAQKIIDEWKQAYQDFTDFATKQNKAAVKDYEEGIKAALDVAREQQRLGLPMTAIVPGGGPGALVGPGEFGRGVGEERMEKIVAQFRLNFENVTDEIEVSLFKLMNGFGDFDTELGKLPLKMRKRFLQILKSMALANPAQFTAEQLEAIRVGLGDLGDESEKDLTQVQVFTQGLRDLGTALGGISAPMAAFVSSLNNFVSAFQTGLTTLQSVSVGAGLFGAGAAIGQSVVSGRAREEAARQARNQANFEKAVDTFSSAVLEFSGKAISKLERAIAKFTTGIFKAAGEALAKLPKELRMSVGRGEIDTILSSVADWLDEISGIAPVADFATFDDWLAEAKANGSDLIKELIAILGEDFFTGAGRDLDELALAWFNFMNGISEDVKRASEEFARFNKDTFTGVMRFLQFEFDQFDVSNPIEQLKRITEELLKFSDIDLTFLNDISPEEAEKAIEAITKLVTGDLDLNTFQGIVSGQELIKQIMDATGLNEQQVVDLILAIKEGNLSSDEVIELLKNIEELNDQAIDQVAEIGEDNLTISRNVSITEQQGVSLISLSNTIVLILRNLEGKVATMTDAIVGAMDRLAGGDAMGTIASVTLPTIININVSGSAAGNLEATGRVIAESFVDDVEARLRAKGIKMIGQKR